MQLIKFDLIVHLCQTEINIKSNSNKLMDQSLVQKKNKQNIDRLNSIINEYELKLDKKVNQVITDMINYTKKIDDPALPPILWDKRIDPPKIQQHASANKHKSKSHSQHTDISFLNDLTLNAQVSMIRNTFKQTQSSKLIPQGGRAVGKQLVTKPKYVRRKPDILPRDVRLNPLHQRNAIKAFELDKGVLSLLQKGKIGKDVNIITAFQKGRPVLQTQKAIFHQGEQRFAQLEGDRQELAQMAQKNKPEKEPPSKILKIDPRQNIYDESWALTMPKQQLAPKEYSSAIDPRPQPPPLSFKQQIYIKIQHYKICQDSHYKQVINKNLKYKADIIQVLHQIAKLMKIYSIDISYADSSKILELVCKTSRLKKEELFGCLVGYKNGNYKNVLNVRGQKQKLQLALQKVVCSFRYNIERKQFLKYLKKKKVANRIYGWAVSCWTVKKHRQLRKQYRKELMQTYDSIQQTFLSEYPRILQKKHYQIHLINEQFPTKQEYKDHLNIQLTKIFNIKNINKHIIYLLSHHVDEDTINYYYKIMELEQIPNYKERVIFIQVDPKKKFRKELNLTQKLYYNSEVIRKVKRKVKDAPAFFIVSYPTSLNIQLSAYFKIPILSGNLHNTLQLDKRSFLDQFELQTVDRFIVDTQKHHNLMLFAQELNQFCQSNRKINKYIIKLDNRNKSKGTALLSAPFDSVPQMYSNTALISEGTTIDEFYHILVRQGGVIEKYEEGTTFISSVLEIEADGNIKMLGTLQKISSGFVNISYIFPQKKIEHKILEEKSKEVCLKLIKEKHFGSVQITFMVNDIQDIYLQKVQCYSTHLYSALHYYKFLSDGELTDGGEYMAKIVDTFEGDGKEEEILTFEPRSFCYIPFLLHFGLSDRQVNSFFQLCRMGGVSFDLQNKYGATFILLGSMKSSMGLITTAKDKKGSLKLMLKSLQFILKQNSHNMSSATLMQKQIRMKQRQNIINVKERLEGM